MLVSEQYRKCVAFLCLPDPQKQWIPVGTGFFMSVEVASNWGAVYLVTARHVVEGARQYGPLYLRLNQHAGPPEFLQIDPDAWHVAGDTDLAVVYVDPSYAERYDMGWLRRSQIATAATLAERHIGPGDDVFFSGLFTAFSGVQRAEPLVRFGNISMMPGEPVPITNADKSQSMVDAFLVEARSWGGQSGSPAFIEYPPTRQPGVIQFAPIQSSRSTLMADEDMPQLLGLVQGHFDLKADVAFTGDMYGAAHVRVNSGIAIVIPAQKIIDTLMMEDVVEERNDNTRVDDSPSSPDSALPDEKDSEWSREDFLRDLRKASRPEGEKPPQGTE